MRKLKKNAAFIEDIASVMGIKQSAGHCFLHNILRLSMDARE
jgi:hypothetical protein